jgi:hypothetical protein
MHKDMELDFGMHKDRELDFGMHKDRELELLLLMVLMSEVVWSQQ